MQEVRLPHLGNQRLDRSECNGQTNNGAKQDGTLHAGHPNEFTAFFYVAIARSEEAHDLPGEKDKSGESDV